MGAALIDATRLKILLSPPVVAAAALAVSAPFLIVERWLGFVVFALIAGTLLTAHSRLRRPDSVRAYAAWLGLAILPLFPAAFFAQISESGFDDGPFHGRAFSGHVGELAPSDSAAFRSGYLVAYNRGDKEAPMLAYRAGGQTRWARELHVSLSESHDPTMLWGISSLSVSRGLVRDRLDFIADWTFGREHGYVYIWKWGGIQRFYLSW